LLGKGRDVEAPALLLVLIQRSAWNRNSAKFAFWAFSEVRLRDPALPRSDQGYWTGAIPPVRRATNICLHTAHSMVLFHIAPHRVGPGQSRTSALRRARKFNDRRVPTLLSSRPMWDAPALSLLGLKRRKARNSWPARRVYTGEGAGRVLLPPPTPPASSLRSAPPLSSHRRGPSLCSPRVYGATASTPTSAGKCSKRARLPRNPQPVEKPLYTSFGSPSRAQKTRHCSVLALMYRCLDAVMDYRTLL
jgi:hypothetical protein